VNILLFPYFQCTRLLCYFSVMDILEFTCYLHYQPSPYLTLDIAFCLDVPVRHDLVPLVAGK